jgi:hypothetical protein
MPNKDKHTANTIRTTSKLPGIDNSLVIPSSPIIRREDSLYSEEELKAFKDSFNTASRPMRIYLRSVFLFRKIFALPIRKYTPPHIHR